MKANDLKEIWRDTHAEKNFERNTTVHDIISKKHCKIVTEVLSMQQKKILVYASTLVIYIGLMVYAFIYLEISLSMAAIIPLSLAGLFLFIKTFSELNHLLILRNTADHTSIIESIGFFRKNLNRIQKFDFLSSLISCYGWAMGITFVLHNDSKGIGNLFPFIIALILILLISPWMIKYVNKQKYKRLDENLNESIDFLNDKV